MLTLKIKNLLHNPLIILESLGHRGFFNWMDDETYLKMIYRARMHKKLDLNNPQTFNEKLQWLKLHDRKPEYTQLVDKYKVRKYIADTIGEQYLIPLLGVWDKFDDIDFNKLPNQFVLKCTHDSGGLVICRDKSKLDIVKARKKLNTCLNQNYYWGGREWPYKNVKPRIIAEKYMVDKSGAELKDYKFFCFNEETFFLYVSQGLENHDTASISFYDLNGKPMPFKRTDYRSLAGSIKMPVNFEKMKVLANEYASTIGSPFLRVDMYEINEMIYFSEFTFTPCAGMLPFEPPEYDKILGEKLEINYTRSKAI